MGLGLAATSLAAAVLYPITRGGAPFTASLAVYSGSAQPLSSSITTDAPSTPALASDLQWQPTGSLPATQQTGQPDLVVAPSTAQAFPLAPLVLAYGAVPGSLTVLNVTHHAANLPITVRVTSSLGQILHLAFDAGNGAVAATFNAPLSYPGVGAPPLVYSGDLLVILGNDWNSYALPASVTLLPQPAPIKPKVLAVTGVKPSIQLTPSGGKPGSGGAPQGGGRSAISLSGGGSGSGHPAPAGRSSGGGGGSQGGGQGSSGSGSSGSGGGHAGGTAGSGSGGSSGSHASGTGSSGSGGGQAGPSGPAER